MSLVPTEEPELRVPLSYGQSYTLKCILEKSIDSTYYLTTETQYEGDYGIDVIFFASFEDLCQKYMYYVEDAMKARIESGGPDVYNNDGKVSYNFLSESGEFYQFIESSKLKDGEIEILTAKVITFIKTEMNHLIERYTLNDKTQLIKEEGS